MSTFIYTRHLPTRDGKATMVMEANTPPEFTLKTDRDDLDLPSEQVVVAYHERTKHHYHRYAASLGYLDWAKQPDPFRRYDGAPLVRLPLPEEGRELPFWQLYVPNNAVPAPLSADSISLFLRYALSLTAWKQFEGTTWPLRANPSSGNLHPTEGYVLCRLWTLSTTVPVYITMHRRRTVSSCERTLTPRSGRP